MSDIELRELERAVRTSPLDRDLSRRWLSELLRAGSIAAGAPAGTIEAASSPGVARGDLVLVARRAFPRATFAWLPAMDALVGEVHRVARLSRDGLTAQLEGPSSAAGPFTIGRSFGFASLRALRSR